MLLLYMGLLLHHTQFFILSSTFSPHKAFLPLIIHHNKACLLLVIPHNIGVTIFHSPMLGCPSYHLLTTGVWKNGEYLSFMLGFDNQT